MLWCTQMAPLQETTLWLHRQTTCSIKAGDYGPDLVGISLCLLWTILRGIPTVRKLPWIKLRVNGIERLALCFSLKVPSFCFTDLPPPSNNWQVGREMENETSMGKGPPRVWEKSQLGQPPPCGGTRQVFRPLQTNAWIQRRSPPPVKKKKKKKALGVVGYPIWNCRERKWRRENDQAIMVVAWLLICACETPRKSSY